MSKVLIIVFISLLGLQVYTDDLEVVLVDLAAGLVPSVAFCLEELGGLLRHREGFLVFASQHVHLPCDFGQDIP